MSLDWNISECKEGEAIKTKEEWPITETLIFQTMTTGINHLKDEAAAREFFRRVTINERLRGTLLHTIKREEGKPDEMEPRPITLADCLKRIGLYTNASPFTAAKFWGKIVPAWAQSYADGRAS